MNLGSLSLPSPSVERSSNPDATLISNGDHHSRMHASEGGNAALESNSNSNATVATVDLVSHSQVTVSQHELMNQIHGTPSMTRESDNIMNNARAATRERVTVGRQWQPKSEVASAATLSLSQNSNLNVHAPQSHIGASLDHISASGQTLTSTMNGTTKSSIYDRLYQ